MAKSFLKGEKTLWKKEKLLVTSNFSFSHSVFKRLVLQTRKNQGLFGKGLRRTVMDPESCTILLSMVYKHPYKLQPIPLSQTTNFKLFETERVWRRQLQIRWKWQKVLKTGRKHCGKRRNCSLRGISPFPTVFSRDLYCRHVKTRACLGKA